MTPASSDTPLDREEALGRVVEDVEALIGAGRPIVVEELAERYGLGVSEVAEVAQALSLMGDALVEPLREPATAPSEGPPPELPAGYEMLGEIGRGGMGVVYKARQASLGRIVAVKVLRPGGSMGPTLERFRKEARSLARLRHPHIVTVHEVGEAAGQVFFSMDWIEGEPLDRLLAQGAVTQSQAVRLLRQITSAIAYSHSRGVVHRDLKPANILVDEDGNAYVVDFGLALDMSSEDALTHTGQIIGTVGYMSPEQARGEGRRIGEASDVYALGVILYECLTGKAPFAGRGVGEVIHAILHEDPPLPHKVDPKVPRELERVCLQAMHKDPEKRYVTARALLEDLERFEEGREVRARSPGVFERLRAGYRRHRATVRVGVLAAILAGVAVWAVIAGRAPETAETMLETARTLERDGQYVAAAAVCDQGLDVKPGADVSPEPFDAEMDSRQHRLRNLWLRCRLAHGQAVAAEGRRAEAARIFEDALATLEKRASPVGRMVHASVEFDLLWALAVCQGERGGEYETLGYERLLQYVVGPLEFRRPDGRTVRPAGYYASRVGVVERIAPALSDTSHPAHESAKVLLSSFFAHPGLRAPVVAWLGSRSAPKLEALLASVPAQVLTSTEQPPEIRGRPRTARFLVKRRWRHEVFSDTQAIVELYAVHFPQRTREALWTAATEWQHPAQASRAWVAHWLSRAVDLPIFLPLDDLGVPQPDEQLEGEILRLYQELGGLTRTESLESRRDYARKQLAAGGDQAAKAARWLTAHRTSQPAPGEDLSALLAAYLEGRDAQRSRAQLRLLAAAPARIDVPVWREDDAEARDLPMAWVRALRGVATPPPYRARSHWWIFKDGELPPTSELRDGTGWFQPQRRPNVLTPGVPQDLGGVASVRTQVRREGPRIDVRWQVPGLAYRTRTALINQPGATTLLMRADTVLVWEVEGPRLYVLHPAAGEGWMPGVERAAWVARREGRDLVAPVGGLAWKRFDRIPLPYDNVDPSLSTLFVATLEKTGRSEDLEGAWSWAARATAQLQQAVEHARSEGARQVDDSEASNAAPDDRVAANLALGAHFPMHVADLDLLDLPGRSEGVYWNLAVHLVALRAGDLVEEQVVELRRETTGGGEVDLALAVLGLQGPQAKLEFWVKVLRASASLAARDFALEELTRHAREIGYEKFARGLYAKVHDIAEERGLVVPKALMKRAERAASERTRERQRGVGRLIAVGALLLLGLVFALLGSRASGWWSGALACGLWLAGFNVLVRPDHDLCVEVLGLGLGAFALWRALPRSLGHARFVPIGALALAALSTAIERLGADAAVFGRLAMALTAMGVVSLPITLHAVVARAMPLGRWLLWGLTGLYAVGALMAQVTSNIGHVYGTGPAAAPGAVAPSLAVALWILLVLQMGRLMRRAG